MDRMIKNASFHHIEVPCSDLELAEQFYVWVFGAEIYMRRDAGLRSNVPVTGTIAEVEDDGFHIDGTYLKIGDGFRIGFLKRRHEHGQREVDHIAFTLDESDLRALSNRLAQFKVEVIDQTADRLMIRDPFGMLIELWPRSVLQRMGLL